MKKPNMSKIPSNWTRIRKMTLVIVPSGEKAVLVFHFKKTFFLIYFLYKDDCVDKHHSKACIAYKFT